VPLDITLNYQSACPAINPRCGGDLVGRWFYTAACVDSSILSQLNQACAGLGGTISLSNVTGTTRGVVTFTNSTVSRDITTTLNATVNIPAQCAIVGCATVQTQLAQLYDSVSCTQAGNGGCDCSIQDTSIIRDSGTYTAAQGIITVTSGGTTRTYDYCRTGTSLVYRETTTPAYELGTLTLELQP
jgi:hypothetical protein